MKYNSETLHGLEQALFSLHPKAEALYKAILVIKDMNSEVVSVGDKELIFHGFFYNKFAPVSEKILFSLRHLGRFSKVSDIRSRLIFEEPEFKKGLSTALTALKKDKKIVIVKPSGSNKESYYGYHSWVDEKGRPLPDKMYKE